MGFQDFSLCGIGCRWTCLFEGPWKITTTHWQRNKVTLESWSDLTKQEQGNTCTSSSLYCSYGDMHLGIKYASENVCRVGKIL